MLVEGAGGPLSSCSFVAHPVGMEQPLGLQFLQFLPISSFRFSELPVCCTHSKDFEQLLQGPWVVQVEGNERQTWILACAHWFHYFPCFVLLSPLYILRCFLITRPADPQPLQVTTRCRGNSLPSNLPFPLCIKSNLYDKSLFCFAQSSSTLIKP